jgi:repressor LexA
MHDAPTPRQRQFLAYLKDAVLQRGTVPSLRQAADEFGVSHAAVAQLVRALEEKGYLRREGRYSRTIHLLQPAGKTGQTAALHRLLEVPVIGRVQAGLPMYAQQEWDGSVVVDRDIFRGTNLFALRVKGDSMQDAGILAGDLAICEPRQYAEDNEIVVALIDNEEATVKHFFRHPDHIELRPANEAYAPMHYGFGEVLIQGKVLGIVRGQATTGTASSHDHA